MTARQSLGAQVEKKAFSHCYRGEINPVMYFYSRQVFPNTTTLTSSEKGVDMVLAKWGMLGQRVLLTVLRNKQGSLVGCFHHVARGSFFATKVLAGEWSLVQGKSPSL